MIKYVLIAVGTILGAGFSSNASTVFSNLGPGNSFSNSGRVLQGESVGTIGNVDQASSFTVGPANYAMTSLELGLQVAGFGAGPLDVILAADAGGAPGAALETISLNLNSSGLVTATASGTTVLYANTTYWVIADAKGTFDGAWNFNNTGDVGPTAYRIAPPNSFAYGPWNVFPSTDLRYALQVNGNVVPEPTTAALAFCGLLTFLAFRRASQK